jgi:hypothetical protein
VELAGDGLLGISIMFVDGWALTRCGWWIDFFYSR